MVENNTYRSPVIVEGLGPLAEGVHRELLERYPDAALVKGNVKRFSNGEPHAEIHDNIRGRVVYVISSMQNMVGNYAPNFGFMTLCALNDAVKLGASADKVVDVAPHIPYGRSDRRDAKRIPIMGRLAMGFLKTSGADRIVTFDLHSSQQQGFAGIPIDNVYALALLLDEFLLREDPSEYIVAAPDTGAISLADAARKYVAKSADIHLPDMVVINKKRGRDGKVRVKGLASGSPDQVKGRKVLQPDDMFDTSGTFKEGVGMLKDYGAREVIGTATHGIFSRYGENREYRAEDRIREAGARVIITNSVPKTPEWEEEHREYIRIVRLEPRIADVIDRIHSGGSIKSSPVGHLSE